MTIAESVHFAPLEVVLPETIAFGMHKGKTWGWLVENDPAYLHYLSRNQRSGRAGEIIAMLCELFPLTAPAQSPTAASECHEKMSNPAVSPEEKSPPYPTIDSEAEKKIRMLFSIGRDAWRAAMGSYDAVLSIIGMPRDPEFWRAWRIAIEASIYDGVKDKDAANGLLAELRQILKDTVDRPEDAAE